MQIKQIIIAHLFFKGSAATNRMLAYATGFREIGIKVVLVFAAEKDFDISLTNDVEVHKCIGEHKSQAQMMAERIKRLYIKGESAILTYGTPTLCWYLPKRKFNIFYECTEIPYYGRKKTIKGRLKESIKSYLAHRATGLFVISKSLKEYYRGRGIKNVAVINMFVDSSRFENVETNSGEKYVAYCGKISSFKDGVDCLIKAFALFSQTHNDYKLKIIGAFENREAEEYLKSLVDEQDHKGNVVFTGMVSPDDMPKLLCGARMLALARPNNEQAKYGFPTKLGEYLSTGKPTVVTNVGEIGCFLKDGVNCKMAKADDEKDFADKMAWVADHYEEALRIGEKGKELTLTEFSSKVQSQKAMEFMKTVVESR